MKVELPHPVLWWMGMEGIPEGSSSILIECTCECGASYTTRIPRPNTAGTGKCTHCGKKHSLKLLFRVDGHLAGVKKKEATASAD